MRFNFKGDWKFLFIAGGLLLLGFLVVGALISSFLSLLVWFFRGIGVLLGSLVRFAFSSVLNFVIVAGLIYLLYRGYVYLKDEKGDKESPGRIEYSDEDFERWDDNHER